MGLLSGLLGCGIAGSESVEPGTESILGAVNRSFQNGVAPSTSYAGNVDTYLSQNAPTSNYGNAGTCLVDGDDPGGSGRDLETLLRWDVASIPAGSVVRAATIEINVTDTTSATYELYELKRAWSETQASWNGPSTGVSWATAGAAGTADRGTTVLGSVTASATGKVTITLNSAGLAVLQRWVNTPSSNFGFIALDTAATNGLDFSSSEATTASLRPRLTVGYDPAGTDAGTVDSGSSVDGGTRTDSGTTTDSGTSSTANFAVVGDYGNNSTAESNVAALIHRWNPQFVLTTGDNNYVDGAASTIDANIGKYYYDFIGNYAGSYGTGASTNRFWPSLGNHDWHAAGAAPYLAYFTLPGNERYYDVVRGPVHFFAIDSDPSEPDGTSSTSTQATWLKNRLAASTSPWKIVYFHHPPYSSGEHQSSTYMRWPFQTWGASIVLSGHEHSYERVSVNGYPYIVNGNGGQPMRPFGTLVAGSVYRNASDFGAQRVTASTTQLKFEFINTANTVLDTLTLTR